jgi:aminoglycoside 6'-N-acetyltransferase I
MTAFWARHKQLPGTLIAACSKPATEKIAAVEKALLSELATIRRERIQRRAQDEDNAAGRPHGETHVRLAVASDCEQLSRLRRALWSESSEEEHRNELVSILAGKRNRTTPLVVFVAEAANRVLAGFLEVGLRSHADGCDPRLPVGFVEGWFVVENQRRKGVGSQLLRAAEDWARNRGCVEMASDTWIDHALSQRVHEALQFEVVDRCVHYRKVL